MTPLQITMTKEAVALREKAVSQGYGTRVVPGPTYTPPPVDRSQFTPKLEGNKVY
jgi:hypothetical protein